MSRYNGWTNWETWNCNLHFNDFYHDEEAIKIGIESHGLTDELDIIRYISTFIKDEVEEVLLDEIKSTESSLIRDILNAFLQEVNFSEIAKAMYDEIKVNINV